MKGSGFLAAATFAALTVAGGTAAAQGDPAQGRQIFESRCTTCHTIEQGGANRIGPNLHGAFGSAVGGRDIGFRYSSALSNADFTWSEETLDMWLADPDAFLPGNRMNFRGLPSAGDREDVIAFLEQNS